MSAALTMFVCACSGGDKGDEAARNASADTANNAVEVIENETYIPGNSTNASGAGSTASAPIPPAFQGRFAGSAAACTRQADPDELTITPAALRFFESEGAVTKVEPISAREVRITARYSGEGQEWTAARTLSLSDDGSHLVADGVTRVRCP